MVHIIGCKDGVLYWVTVRMEQLADACLRLRARGDAPLTITIGE